MFNKTWFAVIIVVATTNATTTLLNITECASPLPCLKTSTPQTMPTLPTTTLAPSAISTEICKNCPQQDCTMVANGTTFSYANHCKLFYQCIDGVAEVCVCPNGYWYDRAISKCMLCDLVLNCEANKD